MKRHKLIRDPDQSKAKSELKIKIYAEQEGLCWYCSRPRDIFELTFEHVYPVIHGGNDTDGNIALTCITCNRLKGKRIIGYASFKQEVDLIKRSVPNVPLKYDDYRYYHERMQFKEGMSTKEPLIMHKAEIKQRNDDRSVRMNPIKPDYKIYPKGPKELIIVEKKEKKGIYKWLKVWYDRLI